jgi:hypothetical protein
MKKFLTVSLVALISIGTLSFVPLIVSDVNSKNNNVETRIDSPVNVATDILQIESVISTGYDSLEVEYLLPAEYTNTDSLTYTV